MRCFFSPERLGLAEWAGFPLCLVFFWGTLGPSELLAQSIAGGRAHSLCVDTNGHLWAWGTNNTGQLGDVTKDKTSRLQPLRVGAETNWEKVFADGDSSFAIKKDGSLWAWGDGQLGQLGDGTRANRSSPVRIGGTSLWQEVSIRDGAVLAIQRDGSLWAWGKNTNGTLGLGRGKALFQVQPTRVGSKTWKSVEVGKYYYTATNREVWTRSFGVDKGGRMWTWGQNASPTSPLFVAETIGEITNWAKVVSHTHTTDPNLSTQSRGFDLPVAVALRNDGKLYQWNQATETFRILDSDLLWSDVGCGTDHLLARGQDGTLWSWGYNEKSQLGRLGVHPDFQAINWAQLSTITYGDGNGSAGGTIGMPDKTKFSVAYHGDVAFGSQAGETNASPWSGLETGGYTAPDNTDILFFHSAPGITNRIEFQDIEPGERAGVYQPVLAVSGLGSVTKDENGEIVGTNTVTLKFNYPCRVLGLYRMNLRSDPMSDNAVIGGDGSGLIQMVNDGPISSLEWEVISSSEEATNTTGFNIGILQTTNLIHRADLPMQVAEGEGSDWGELAGGETHSLGIKNAQLMAWGDNSSGQCANSRDNPDQLQPGTPSFTNLGWVQILPGKDFTLMKKANGDLYAMGNAEATNRSDGRSFYREPTNLVASYSWQDVGAFESVSSNSVGKRIFGIETLGGALVGWGGRDGLDANDGFFYLSWWDPLQDTFGTLAGPWNSLSSNIGKGTDSHILAVRSDGTLWTWGANTNGQLGDGTRMMKDAPIQVGNGTNWKRVFAGGAHSLALQNDGSLWGWGENSNGAIGLCTNLTTVSNSYSGGTNSTNSNNTSPKVYSGRSKTTTVVLASNVLRPALVLAKGWGVGEVSAGGSHNLILRKDGSLWAMGANDQGQLGTGTVLSTNTNGSGTNTNSSGSNSTNGYRTTTVSNVATNINVAPWRVETNVDTVIDQTWMYRVQRVGKKTWSTISAGETHSLAIRTDGTLWGWGANEGGQVGDGTRITRRFPVQIGPANNWRQVWAGHAESFAIKKDGTLYQWGYNTNQAGLGNDVIDLPTQVDFGKLGLGTLVLRQGSQLVGMGILSFQPGNRYVDVSVQLGSEAGSRLEFTGGTNFTANPQSVQLPALSGVLNGQTSSLAFSSMQRKISFPQSSYSGTAHWAKQQYQAELVLGSDRDGDGFPDETDILPDGPLPKPNSPVQVEGRVNKDFHYEITTKIQSTESNPIVFLCESDLPDGLAFEDATISGIPTKIGRTSLVVGASNNAGRSFQVLQINIIPESPSITSTDEMVWTNGSRPFFYQLTTQTNHPDYPLRFSSKGLPPGLRLNPKKGEIRPGNPENRTVPDPGLYRATLVAAHRKDQASQDLLIKSVGTNWRVGKPLQFEVRLRGEGQVEFSNLPAGLKGNPRSGTVAGVPSVAVKTNVKVRQSKAFMGEWVTFPLTISPAAKPAEAEKREEGMKGSGLGAGQDYPAIFSLGPVANQALEANGRTRNLPSPVRSYAMLWTNVERWKWEGNFPGLATRLQEAETGLRRSERAAGRQAIPWSIRLAQVSYGSGQFGMLLPTNHVFWLKQANGMPSLVGGNLKEARIDFSQPGFVQLLGERVKFLVQSGCVDGVYLPDWDEAALWPPDASPSGGSPGGSQVKARLALLKAIREAVGPQGWIVAEAGGNSWQQTGPWLDGIHLVGATEPPPTWPPAEGWWPDPYLFREGDSTPTLWDGLVQSLKLFGQPGILRRPGQVMLELWARRDLRDGRTKQPRLNGLAMSLCLSDGAYLYARPDWWREKGKAVAPGEHLWFPEWSLRLGRPMESLRNQVEEGGFYQRQFANGWAAYAPWESSSAVKVEFAEEVESVATGKRGFVHEMMPGQGDLFLKKN